MKKDTYHYTESGLDNVYIAGLKVFKDEKNIETVEIKHIKALHKAITLGLTQKPSHLTGKELRFLRTELGLTQGQLAQTVQRELLTISRWERSEVPIDPNAEAVIRMLVQEELQITDKTSVKEIMQWTVPNAETFSLKIKGEKPNEYSFDWAA